MCGTRLKIGIVLDGLMCHKVPHKRVNLLQKLFGLLKLSFGGVDGDD